MRLHQLSKVTNYQTPRDGTALSSPHLHLTSKHNLIKQCSTQLDNVISQLNSNNLPAINQKTFVALLTLFDVCCAQSFSLVEHPMFRLLMSAVCPQFHIPTRTTLSTSGLDRLYSYMAVRIHRLLTESQFESMTICLDVWLCKPKTVSYVVFNGVFFASGKWTRVMLKFCELKHPHSGEHVKELLSAVLKDFKLEKKIIFYNTDEGSNLVKALEGQNRTSCLCHRLHNFVAVDWYQIDPVFKNLVVKCKAIAHFLHSRSNWIERFYSKNQNELEGFEGIEVTDLNKRLEQIHDDIRTQCDEYSIYQQIEESSKDETDCKVIDDELADNELADNGLVDEVLTDDELDDEVPTDDELDDEVLTDDELADEMLTDDELAGGKPAAPTRSRRIRQSQVTRWDTIKKMSDSFLVHKDCVIFVASKLFRNDLLLSQDE